MDNTTMRQQLIDRGGRRRLKDRRFRVSMPSGGEKRTNWKRRCGFDSRIEFQENKNPEKENNVT